MVSEMMNWHLTWQDPVALALCAAGLGFAWWIRRRVALGDRGCDTACGQTGAPEIVATDQLRLGRPRQVPPQA